ETTSTLTGATIGTLSADTYFRAVVQSGVCAAANSESILVTVNPVSVGGVVSSPQTICSGNSPADLTLSDNTGSIVKWQKSSDAVFTTPTDIAETTSTLTGATIGTLSADTYFRAVVQSGVCAAANSESILVTVNHDNTVAAASSAPTLCINTALMNITHGTAGVTGIGIAANLPAGVTAAWASNVITISGTPKETGTFAYSIPLTGGCGNVLNATGTITVVTPPNAGTITGIQNIHVAETTPFASSGTAGGTWKSSDISKATVNSSTGVVTGVSAGTATITYTVIGTGECTNAIAALTVKVRIASIDAVADTGISVNGSTGGISLTNVLTNDTLNGSAVVPSDVNTTFVSATNPGITLSGTNVLVAPGTPGGTYTLNYRICEILNPDNCDDAVVTVKVFSNPSIALVKTALFKDENGDGHAQAGETVIYNFEVTNTGDVALTNVSITDPLPGIVLTGNPISLAVGESDRTTFVGIYRLKQSDINSGSVSNQATVIGTSYDGIIVKDNSDDSSNLGDNPTVLGIEGCSIEVFNAVSPNGDGSNDLFYVRGLECYPDNSVEIYNRWGVLVFERDQYNNTDRAFKGISEGRVTINASAELPVGTYYYILKYKDYNSTGHQKAGYLYINRK
ncbi:gliding motility-associated C-terminal domain-containing protein, partial [Flavobacterium sp. T12S277]|uniref:T9SS type B sorting domain-containing protein n=1 Tax=Flavobacterium sp. T12S277 TaxID=3402752 RepID=UPI003ADA02E5